MEGSDGATETTSSELREHPCHKLTSQPASSGGQP